MLYGTSVNKSHSEHGVGDVVNVIFAFRPIPYAKSTKTNAREIEVSIQNSGVSSGIN